MFRIDLKRSIATVSVIAGALALAGPANAGRTPPQNTMVSGLVHAPSGQARVAEDPSGFIESQYVPSSAGVTGTDDLQRRTSSGIDVWRVFSGDAYDNEMGITTQAEGAFRCPGPAGWPE